MSQRIDSVSGIDPSFYDDFNGLQAIKSNPDQRAALETAAGQFEVEFLQTVLKHMRAASEALQTDEENPFASKQQEFYRDMYDSQLAMSMVKQGGIGLKEQMVTQLEPTLKNESPTVAVPQEMPDSFRQSLHTLKRKAD